MVRVALLAGLASWLAGCSLALDFDSLQAGDSGITDGQTADGSADGGLEMALPDMEVTDTSDMHLADFGPEGAFLVCRDEDGDGYGDPADCLNVAEDVGGYVRNGDDCADDSATAYPGAPELCNGRDDSCEGAIDEGWTLVTEADDLSNQLRAASGGARFCVAGTHIGTFVVDKNILVAGQPGAVLSGAEGESQHVLVLTSGMVQGFTIQGGNSPQGAGVYLPRGSAELRSVWIHNNGVTMTDNVQGAGLHIAEGAILRLEQSRVSDNFIEGGTFPSGAGIYVAGTLIANHVRIEANTVSTTNGTEISGAGIAVRGMNASMTAHNLIILANTAEFSSAAGIHAGTGLSIQGGGTVSMINCAIVENSHRGGEASFGVGVFLDNRFEAGSSRLRATFINVINAYNTSELGALGNAYYRLGGEATTIHVTFGDVFENTGGGDSNVDYRNVTPVESLRLDPAFVSVRPWDLRLAPGSACIDFGDPSLRDADATRSDIGAYGGPGGADWDLESEPRSSE